MFIRLYEAAKNIGDDEIISFSAPVLDGFEKNDVNGHIIWKK